MRISARTKITIRLTSENFVGIAIELSVGDAVVVFIGDAVVVFIGDAVELSVGDTVELSVGDAVVVFIGDAVVVFIGDAVVIFRLHRSTLHSHKRKSSLLWFTSMQSLTGRLVASSSYSDRQPLNLTSAT